jgi:hypothetical protein
MYLNQSTDIHKYVCVCARVCIQRFVGSSVRVVFAVEKQTGSQCNPSVLKAQQVHRLEMVGEEIDLYRLLL